MALYKYIAIGLLFISIGLAIDIRMPANLTLAEGEVKDIQINVSNTLNEYDTIGILGFADNATLVVIPPSRTLSMERYTSTNTTFTISSQNAKPGTYNLTFLFSSAGEKKVFSRSMLVKVEQSIEITPVYSYVKVMQGDFITLKFTVTNTGKSTRSIIVDPESFPDEFKPEYPNPFYLNPRESRTVSVKITIPADYHSGVYSEKIILLSGEIRAESEPFDLSIARRSEYKDVVNINAIELGGYMGENGERGYNLMMRIDNRKDEPVTGIEVAGFPLGWNVSGDIPFSIGANSVKDVTVRVFPTDLNEHKIDVLLLKDSLVLTNTTLTFSGSKAGLVGQAILGGSLTIGLLIIVILVLVLLFIRQKNIQADETEKMQKLGYLKELVDEAKRR